MTERTKFLLDESKLPEAWYNINADMPVAAGAGVAPWHTGTGDTGVSQRALPHGADHAQEVSTDRWISTFPSLCAISTGYGGPPPSSARADWSRRWRLQRTSTTSTKVSAPSARHKPNTAVPQAYYNKH
jgi:tryptophan synthase beta chain